MLGLFFRASFRSSPKKVKTAGIGCDLSLVGLPEGVARFLRQVIERHPDIAFARTGPIHATHTGLFGREVQNTVWIEHLPITPLNHRVLRVDALSLLLADFQPLFDI